MTQPVSTWPASVQLPCARLLFHVGFCWFLSKYQSKLHASLLHSLEIIK